MNTTWLETSRAKPTSCVTIIMVMPSLASACITLSTSPTISGSSALVGSSNSIMSGCMHNARAMATRCFCPPESCAGNAYALSASPTRSSRARAVSVACALVAFLRSMGARVMLSRIFRWLNRLKCWNTMPISSRALLMSVSLAVMSCPFTTMLPALIFSSRLIQRSSVLLPEPEGPSSTATSPSFISSEISFSTSNLPKLFSRWSILTIHFLSATVNSPFHSFRKLA